LTVFGPRVSFQNKTGNALNITHANSGLVGGDSRSTSRLFSQITRTVEALWWALTLVLMLVGLVGTVVPLMPGTILILCGAVLNHFALHSVGWPTLVVLTVMMILAQALDIVSGSIGAKWFGATRWGAIGGILGAIVGLFFGLIGIFVGPLVGALIGELLGGKGLLPAGRSSWGTVLGTTAGIIGKFGIGLLMIVWFLIAAFVK
jgi:uncharacterized protein YqgC (DUF456 family)